MRAFPLIAAAALAGGFALGVRFAPERADSAAPPAAPPAADPLDIALPALDGSVSSLAGFEGRRVLVNFWATWCAPCLEEIPDLVALSDELRAEGREATIVGVAIDDVDAVERFLVDHPIDYPLFVDPDAGMTLSNAFGNDAGVLPFNVVLAADGRVVYAEPGALTTAEAGALLRPAADADPDR